MKIVADDKIPYIHNALEEIADEVVYLKGAAIKNSDVRDADALIVRTRTHCDRELLEGSSVSFIATATIGFDHIDTQYLKDAGIKWMNCPGCNAGSVAQYLRSTLILLCRHRGLSPQKSTVGVVGCGHVGTKVVSEARAMGLRVLVCDPPLKDAHCLKENFVSMEQIESESDVITFHVPLTYNGQYPSFHLADKAFFRRLKRHPIIINTSRGGVVDNPALLNALESQDVKEAVIDTWEDEPQINLPLLQRTYIGTPHIAGYSADGKTNADNMVINGLCQHFGIENKWNIVPPALPKDFIPSTDEEELRLQLYNPLTDSEQLKCHPEAFEDLRGNYPLRREKL